MDPNSQLGGIQSNQDYFLGGFFFPWKKNKASLFMQNGFLDEDKGREHREKLSIEVRSDGCSLSTSSPQRTQVLVKFRVPQEEKKITVRAEEVTYFLHHFKSIHF